MSFYSRKTNSIDNKFHLIQFFGSIRNKKLKRVLFNNNLITLKKQHQQRLKKKKKKGKGIIKLGII